MVDEVAGVLSVAGVLLAYLLLLEAMTAAVLLLAQYVVIQTRTLRTLFHTESSRTRPVPVPSPTPVDQDQGEGTRVVIGGAIRRWD